MGTHEAGERAFAIAQDALDAAGWRLKALAVQWSGPAAAKYRRASEDARLHLLRLQQRCSAARHQVLRHLEQVDALDGGLP